MTAPSDPSIVSSLAIGASVEEIARVSEWLNEMADGDDWPDRLRFGMELSVEEALANVISYGFAHVPHAPEIRIDYLHLPDTRVAVRIADNGTAFDPTAVVSPDMAEDVEGARIGGHGVRLMRHFLDDISYERADGENRLTLVARLGTAE
ncbi:ATP-binding protein [Aquabacter spiritensis]|uniref:Anti-sigma regulatory factor (Ser/Thr protein kinase) n=1 Tax=Aquabacter spiritensis TaxID=933073 RepID=A0A4R3M546_9HYPH|nr:ATP-binding protein [Aquabacter spiritensis]TCT07996.1 anti-sigma regulatory factor (Ser/Thr protein kinase) [Aquabacter spiritensis]